MAISTGAALLGGGSAILGSGAVSGFFGNKAAQAQTGAYNSAAAQLRRNKQEALGFLQPFAGLGEQAINPLSSLLLGRGYDPETGEFTDISPEERLDQFQESPGFQFNLQQGQKALESSQAARGGLFSGRAGLEALQFGAGTASQEYNSYINQLQGLVQGGQQAAGASANTVMGFASPLADVNIGLGNIEANKNIGLANTLSSSTDQFLKLAGGSF